MVFIVISVLSVHDSRWKLRRDKLYILVRELNTNIEGMMYCRQNMEYEIESACYNAMKISEILN